MVWLFNLIVSLKKRPLQSIVSLCLFRFFATNLSFSYNKDGISCQNGQNQRFWYENLFENILYFGPKSIVLSFILKIFVAFKKTKPRQHSWICIDIHRYRINTTPSFFVPKKDSEKLFASRHINAYKNWLAQNHTCLLVASTPTLQPTLWNGLLPL